MQLQNDIILLAGDSWPAGIFETGVEGPVGPGISENLQNIGYQVRNLSKPGGSNFENIDRVKDWLKCNPHELTNIKFILFWQTEFFREIWYGQKINVDIEKELDKGYTQLRDEWVYRPYYLLSEISQRRQIPVYVLGGASDTVWYDDFEKDFPGVRIACQSVTNLLIENNHRIDQPVFCEFLPGWVDQFLSLVKKNIAQKDLQQLLDDMELGENRIKNFASRPDYFYPDGMHPNKNAHNKIFEFLLARIPELKNATA